MAIPPQASRQTSCRTREPPVQTWIYARRYQKTCLLFNPRGPNQSHSAWPANPIPPPEKKQPKIIQPSKRYHCVLCDLEWVHDFSKPLSCPNCHSHLYAKDLGWCACFMGSRSKVTSITRYIFRFYCETPILLVI